MSHFNLPLTVVKNQPTDVDPLLKRKLKVYGKESAHTFVDQLFGGQLLSTVICDSCHHSYQILEPFMDLSLPVSEDKSPPTSHKRKTNVVDSLSCLGSSTPVTPSKHQRKKERKAGRRGKGRRFDKEEEEEDLGPVNNTQVNEHPPAMDEPASSGVEDDSTSMKTDDTASMKTADKETDKGDGDDEEESLVSSGREDEEDDVGGDVEDNNEEVNELVSRIEQVHVDSTNEEDGIEQLKMDDTVKGNRSAEQLIFPLNQPSLKMHSTKEFTSKFKVSP